MNLQKILKITLINISKVYTYNCDLSINNINLKTELIEISTIYHSK